MIDEDLLSQTGLVHAALGVANVEQWGFPNRTNPADSSPCLDSVRVAFVLFRFLILFSCADGDTGLYIWTLLYSFLPCQCQSNLVSSLRTAQTAILRGNQHR